MKLINPTDEQLNAAFAEKVAGWALRDEYHMTNPPKLVGKSWLCGQKWICIEADLPNFTQSADAVLPWLEKCGHWQAHSSSKGIHIFVEYPDRHNRSDDQSFSRAAVIALLRANGVEVEFTSSP